MFAKLKKSLYNQLRGRYGIDSYSNFLLGFGLILAVITLFVRNSYVYIGMTAVAWICFVYAYIRMFSKNYEKRSAQNRRFLACLGAFRTFVNRKKAHYKISRTHKIFTCPGCRQKIKVPKGKGNVVISCPKCRMEFTGKS
ncbi:MAG: hypothetical protein IKN24_01700 [Lachnospiraceae bacterium]|nr:hypothetical protein [Lachnospiraceae bacterium]